MARSFLAWAVGPLSPGRVGAVLGFVVGCALAILVGNYGNLVGLAVYFTHGPAGALVGYLLGRLYGRWRRRDDAKGPRRAS